MNKNKIIIIVILTIILGGLGIGGYLINQNYKNNSDSNKKDNNVLEENQDDSQKDNQENNLDKAQTDITVIFNAEDKIWGIKNDGKIVEVVNNMSSYAYTTENGILYYVDDTYYLHKVNLSEPFTDENLNIEVDKGIFVIHVSGNNLIGIRDYSSGGQNNDAKENIYNLETKKVEELPFYSNSNAYFKNDNFFYSTEYDSLNCYNVKTKQDTKLFDGSRVLIGNGDKFVYLDEEDNMKLYDIVNKSSTLLKKVEEITENEIVMNNNDVYYIYNNSLYKNSDKIKDLKPDGETNYDISKINENTLIIVETKIDKDFENNSYIYNINENTITKSSVDYSMIVSKKLEYLK